MKTHNDGVNRDDVSLPATATDSDTADTPAWEMIEPGRYQPRRIRGSHRGRHLG
jgi:hypothetical protein